MEENTKTNEFSIESLSNFFNHHHDKLLCTANNKGEPSIALMGTPRLAENGTIEFEISDPVSVTLQNMKENKAVVFMAYIPGVRARDYTGARIYAEVTEILSSGEKIDHIRTRIRERHGEEKAAELLATVTCRIKKVRPVVDRGQRWDEPPFGHV
ncbi:hypothetical protein GO755_17010 [Spirosoma sp. HMF4905]|uniref:Pyridoxamine 5'-phosphate oxidase family protein n=1 Tax=Spirosoma arboris TaxID=2682092 RepID=A0A7K1SD78_9BACT|nr:hypothetical protein [Spirosoma arboris]MVM31750.1 hypothetical protein [Spirosoma arboris]